MFNVIQLNTAEGLSEYEILIKTVQTKNPYYLVDYLDVFCDGFNDLICFYYIPKDKNEFIIMPGHLRQIVIDDTPMDYFDFTTPYGYSGPLITKNIQDSHLQFFWEQVDNWYKQNKVVTEFIRFSLEGNHAFYTGIVHPTMLNIRGAIISEEDQWKAFDYKVRKNIKRAQNENLISQIYYESIEEFHVKEFYEVYIQTMIRTNAKESFFYKFDDFLKFITSNKLHVAICTVYFDSTPISTELLLVSNNTIFSFLGGTDEAYFDKRPNDFLKFEVINWARKMKFKHYVLGGGYGFEDGIFKYKKAFFPDNVVCFNTGRKIVNKTVYDELVEKLLASRAKKGLEQINLTENNFFPSYRFSN